MKKDKIGLVLEKSETSARPKIFSTTDPKTNFFQEYLAILKKREIHIIYAYHCIFLSKIFRHDDRETDFVSSIACCDCSIIISRQCRLSPPLLNLPLTVR